ncbi:MAG: ABC transporter ATP-binding protein, partial [Clostridia bacterium]|nr:ABC transporter ATP-binding protein [Clostridia bacterium]
FSVAAGESTGIVGANGAGKSTLLKTALGLLNFEGTVLIGGAQVNKKNLPLIRKTAGYLLQDSDNQMFMPTVLDDMAFAPVNYGKSRAEAEKAAKETLESLGAGYLIDKYNHKLSGGEKKLAAVATVMTAEPEILLLDEPSASLDPKNRRKIINILNSINKTKLIASHDLDFILDTCEKVMILNNGELVCQGSAGEILQDAQLLDRNGLELPLRYYGR